jgi:hypothetical protein
VRLTVPPGVSLDLSFMTPGSLDPRITFTRASTATYFDSTGTMRTAATSAPRWDYNPSTHALNGLLIEEARTNTLFPSVPDAGAIWAQSGSVAKGGSVVAPDGTTSTTSLFSATDTSNSVRAFSVASPASASTTYTVTAFMKKGPTTNGYIQVNIAGGVTVVPIAYYDLTAGTAVVGADLIAGATNLSASIVACPNGWYRVRFTFTTNAGAGSVGVYIGPCVVVSPTGDNRSYVGVVGQGIYAWGAQLEAGVFPTSYIPTTTGSVTRAADSCSISVANMSPWFVSPGGSWMMEFINFIPSPPNSRVIGNTGTGGGITPLFLPSSLVVGQYDATTAVQTANSIVVNAISKAASTWAVGQAKMCANGGAVATSATLTSGYTGLAAGGVTFMGNLPAATDNTSGYIRRVRYWPRALSNAELQQVTT